MGAAPECATLNTTSVNPICQQRSLSRNDVIQYNREVACLTPLPASDKTHSSAPVAPGDRCVTAAWQEPGDLARQTE